MSSDEHEGDDFGDWEKLETIKTFDVSDGSASTKLADNTINSFKDGFIESVTTKATAPVSLLVESLVQQLCSMLDPDPVRSEKLYRTICAQLHRMNLIDETYLMGEFDLMRSQYQRALYQLATVAREQKDLQSVWPLPESVGMSWSRYHREFDEISFIAGGGFGRVYRARHKLDGIEYAVKKITIKYTTINCVLSHLAEVKTFASLNHTNIVPYKAAWLEPLFNNGSDNAIESHQRKKGKLKSPIVPVKNGENVKLFDNVIDLFVTETDDDEDEDEDDDDDADEENSSSTEDIPNFDFHVQNKRFLSKKKSRKIFERMATNNDESSDFIEFQRNESKVSIEDVSETTNVSHCGGNAITHRKKEEGDKALCKQAPPYSHNNNYINNIKTDLSFDESQPHLKLKWATLYIQMAFRPLTLRSWLDDRNKYSDFNEFYKNFLKKSVLENQNTSDNNNCDATEQTTAETNSENKQVRQTQMTNRERSNSNVALNECLAKHYDLIDVAIDIFSQVLNGLNYIHLQNIVHHDIKPSNIFIGCERNGKLYVQLGDFGLACPLQAKHVPNGMIGTKGYAAPEQWEGKCNPKSDLFSLGIILLELLVPFMTDMERVKTIEQAHRGILPKEIPQKYVDLLKKLLQNHKKRPDTTQLSILLSNLQSSDDSNVKNSGSRNEPQQNELQKQLNELTSELNTLKLRLSSTSSKESATSSTNTSIEIDELTNVKQPIVSTSQQNVSPHQRSNSSNSKTKRNSSKSISIHIRNEKIVHKNYKKELRKKEMELKLNVNEAGDKDKLIAKLKDQLMEMNRKECELSQEVKRLRIMLNERSDDAAPLS